ncbi:MAG TPA: endo-inulinase [Micromonosporaceae bacterium]|nr:endo-inulinase [Micromonosporaceae bacterium]
MSRISADRSPARWLAAVALIMLLLVQLMPLPGQRVAVASASDIVNPDFESGDLTGWTATGNAFTNGVTSQTGWGWGCCFGHHGTYHLWGFATGGDAATGTLTSTMFQLAGTGQVSFLLGGGNDLGNLYVALARASDGAILFRATGRNEETYHRVTWDASVHLGQDLYLRAVDNSTGGWGHLNLDDVRVYDEPAASDIVNPDFETGNLTGWTATGSAFTNGVTSQTGWGWGCCFGHHGTYHLWGFASSGDSATGTLTSSTFRLGGTGQVSFLLGGGNDLGNLYVALVRASDGAILFRATGRNEETYHRVTWDASVHVGQNLYLRAVDNAGGGWGHLNLDDVRVYQQPPVSGLIAHWPFSEGSGTVVRDTVSGIQDPITYVFTEAKYKPSSPPLWRSGPSGHGVLADALLFDGYSTWVTRPASQLSTPTQALTVEAWVAPRAFEWGDEGKLSAIVDQHDEGARQGFILGVGRHGRWSFQAGIGGTWNTVWSSPDKSLQRDRWHHVAATFDSVSHTIRLYLDGALAGEGSTAVGELTRYPGNMLIGKHHQGVVINGTFSVNMFAGLIDEVKLRSNALSGNDIANVYQAAVSTFANGVVPTPDLGMRRSRYDGDIYRPQYHFLAPEHWMNEPHAPIYVGGQYHLFYQHNQHGPYWHNISWGHAISPDLVRWRDAPVALVPTADSVAPDGIWSGGSTLDASGNPLLFLTAGDDSVFPNQRTGVARCPGWPSDNNLNAWAMDQAPVTVQSATLDVGAGRKVRYGDFRDPYVWREGDTWFQLVGSGVQTTGGADVGGTALLYTSTDLTNWIYAGPLMVGDMNAYPKTGQVWELPVFLPLGVNAQGVRKHILLTNPAWGSPSEHNVKYVWYWIGTWDAIQRRFIPDSAVPRLFDYGEHFTGPSGFVDPQGRSVVFSIAQDKRTERAHFDAGWAHNAGLPIVLSLQPDGDIAVQPLPELTTLHHTTAPILSITGDTSLATANQQLASISGDMLHLTLELAAGSSSRFGIKLRRSPGGEEETLVYYDVATQTLNVDRTKSGTNSSLFTNLGVQGGSLPLAGQNLKLDIYLDKSMIEIYANGSRSITTRAYPFRADSLGLQLWADGSATVKAARIWEMTSAHQQ